MAKAKSDKVANAIAAALDAAAMVGAPIEGGPVSVPLERAGALWLLPWICEPECRVAFRLSGPKTQKPTTLYVTWEDTRDALRILREISAELIEIDVGTLEMVAASSANVNAALAGDDDEDEEDAAGDGEQEADAALRRRRDAAARFRLSGPIERGRWTITHAAPAITAKDFGRALEILDLVDGTSAAWARDAREAQAVADQAARATGFARTNPAQVHANALSVEGARITVLDDRRPYLAMIVFRHRLGDGPWDVRTHQQWDEKFLADYVESLRAMNERAAKLREQYYAPRLAALLETPTTTYFETDFARIPFSTESVTPLLWKRIPGLNHLAETTFAEAIDLVDTQFAEAGYRPLGDYQHARSDRREAYRVYGGAADGSFALWGIVAGSFSMHWFFYSLLGDDFWVATATFALPDGARRPPRLSHRGVQKMSIVEQAAEHAKHLAEHAAQGAAHVSPTTLAEFLPIIERFNAALA